ncbi:MAG: hypothetical protein ABEI53_02835 [Candidatus Magasanikbacteria bacterium]
MTQEYVLTEEERELAIKELAGLLEEAKEAHHQYEQEELGGETDENWAEFYAEYILERFQEMEEEN